MKRALGRVARLAGVVQSRGHRGCGGGVEVSGAQQDERVGPAKLQNHLLHVASGDLRNRCTGGIRACEGDAVDPGIPDHSRDLLVAGIHVDVGPIGKPCLEEQRMKGGCRLWALRCVLHQDRVSHRQVGGCEPTNLVVRVVPRHDAQDRSEGAAPDQRRAGPTDDFDMLVLKERRGVVGVVGVDPRSEVDLGQRLRVGLACLPDDDPREVLMLLHVQFSHAP
jgi:hypothetical protein